MKRSASRILTTHTGSLPRSVSLQELLREREEQVSFDVGPAYRRGPRCSCRGGS